SRSHRRNHQRESRGIDGRDGRSRAKVRRPIGVAGARVQRRLGGGLSSRDVREAHLDRDVHACGDHPLLLHRGRGRLLSRRPRPLRHLRARFGRRGQGGDNLPPPDDRAAGSVHGRRGRLPLRSQGVRVAQSVLLRLGRRRVSDAQRVAARVRRGGEAGVRLAV
ncbi:hypothetical protein ACHAWF_002658, partial [Thalassiosira exigua]